MAVQQELVFRDLDYRLVSFCRPSELKESPRVHYPAIVSSLNRLKQMTGLENALLLDVSDWLQRDRMQSHN